VLAVDGSNYPTWATDVEIKLDGMSLDHTIVQPEAGKDERTKPDKARALHFLRHHLHLDMKSEYMTERDPLVLWQSLKDRFSQQLMIMLPRAQQAWITLHFQDYKFVAAYNFALHRIVTKMRLCVQKITNADMIEKTLATFHPSNILLQQKYKNLKYYKYFELSEVLYVAEQHNVVLMSNRSSRPTSSIVVLEAHATVVERSRNWKWGRGKGKWKGKRGALFKGNGESEPKGRYEPEKERGDHSGEEQGECYICGARGHWSRRCCTPKHLIDLYQQSKNKGKGQHKSHFITKPKAQKCDDIVVNANDENFHMDGSEENLLDDMDISRDLE
jgi:hypothetical protein